MSLCLRYRKLRQISRFFPPIFSGSHFHQCNESKKVSSLVAVNHAWGNKVGSTPILNIWFPSQRYSTVSELLNERSSVEANDVLNFIESSYSQLKGPHHCWLNKVEGDKEFFKKDGTILVLAVNFFDNSQIVPMIEKVKSLQQRFPHLCIMGFHSGTLFCSAADQTHLVELLMEEYVTIPILLPKKSFSEMRNEACYILFKDLKDTVIYLEKDLDLGILIEAIEELHVQRNENSNKHNVKSTWWKQLEIAKEPHSCSFLQNLFFNFPGCISADESGNRLFLSDSNHHRIIICDGNGKIIDCIGSSPGFEDGDFESAKLLRPAASFYDDEEDCLYIVDSENHAIRRADMERRVIETLYPTSSIGKKNNTIWTRIASKLGFGSNVESKSEELNSQSLLFPWHLLKLDDSFLIINRRFETLWIMDKPSGKVKECIKGFAKVLETCEQLILDKLSLLKQLPIDWLQHQTDANCPQKGLPHASLISSLTTFEDQIVICDTVAQRVLKLSRESGACSNFQFSNFGILGLPYWLPFPLERVYHVAGPSGASIDHVQSFSLLPGRVDMKLNVEIPMDTELVEPLKEQCIWRQARGAATEVIGAKGIEGSSEKVGVAQQWYDELDNLAFSTEESEETVEDDNTTSDMNPQDDRIHIDCAVNTSPGTSEVIIYAALYLKLRGHHDLPEDSQEKLSARIADILNAGRNGETERDLFIQHLLKSKSDLRDLIFVKPLHVRIKFGCPDHPKADNSKEIILTNSSIEVNVSLNT